MSRVITFSRVFPSYHPRKGEPTNFVRSIWEGLDMLNMLHPLDDAELEEDIKSFYEKMNYTPKWHTFRAGNRWKEGDWFSPRVWSGKPYRSHQIIIAPDIEVKKVFKVYIEKPIGNIGDMYINDKMWQSPYDELSTNDGLSNEDFIEWIIKPTVKKEFDGQIICWNEDITY